MFNVGWSELLLILALGFILFKPQEFPSFFHTVYRLYKTVLTYLQHLRSNFHSFAEEMEIESIKHQSFQQVRNLEKDSKKTKHRGKEKNESSFTKNDIL